MSDINLFTGYIYIVYYNNETEVLPLKSFGYNPSFFEIFDQIHTIFASKIFGNPDVQIKIVKYEETVNSTPVLYMPLLKADVSFPEGLSFVRKNHEAFIYRKIKYPGAIYDTFVVKYLGRIGVLEIPSPEAPINPVTDLEMRNLNIQIGMLDKIIEQQDKIIQNQSLEIEELNKIGEERVKNAVATAVAHALENAHVLENLKEPGVSEAQRDKSFQIHDKIRRKTQNTAMMPPSIFDELREKFAEGLTLRSRKSSRQYQHGTPCVNYDTLIEDCIRK